MWIFRCAVADGSRACASGLARPSTLLHLLVAVCSPAYQLCSPAYQLDAAPCPHNLGAVGVDVLSSLRPHVGQGGPNAPPGSGQLPPLTIFATDAACRTARPQTAQPDLR